MENNKHPFSADRPITLCAEDLLGRSGFAKSIAAAIRGWTGNESLVIALYGSWGSGKTSIKNMAIEALRSSEETCPLIVEFNPWQWAGQEQLADAFFQQIGFVLGKDTSKEGKKRIAKWRAYAAYLKVLAPI
jgi:predicted KAP-like P-loop ATPase